MGYRRDQSTGSDPMWLLMCAVFIIALCLIALPAIITGLILQRILSSRLHWRVHFAIWFILSLPSGFFLYLWLQGSLQIAIAQDLIHFVQAAKLYQYDLTHWPMGDLWASTWSLWVQTFLVGVPISGLWFEIISNMRMDTSANILQEERNRKRHIASAEKKARKRTRGPVPDTAGKAMVIGSPIQRDKEPT
jgi:hypothetical protein